MDSDTPASTQRNTPHSPARPQDTWIDFWTLRDSDSNELQSVKRSIMPEMVFGFILFVRGGLSRGYVMSRLRESGTSVRLFGGRSKEIHYLKRYLELVRKNRDIYNGRYGLPGTALLTGTAQGQNLILLHVLGHIRGLR